MKSSDSITLLTKYKLLLVLLALLAAAFIFLATSRYGAGLTPDSVDYIGTARNIIAGAGFNTYDGNPIVNWPPLYPVLLALVSVIFRSDPLFLANVLNAFIFGLIVYVGGVLTFKHLSTFPALAFVGTLAILVSIPLFKVSIMAWSEPLFILLLLLGLLFAKSYLEKKDILSLMLLSISVALASLTRYIGVTLILWGVFIIIGFYRDTLKNKLVHLSLFTLISFPPIGIWLIRNYVISSTLFGPRTSSAHGLSQNLIAVFNSLKIWYIPGIIADHLPTTLIFLGVVFSFFVGLNLKDNWQSMKVVLRQNSSIIVFIIVYTTFLVISSTTSAFDAINDRLLAPIYVPLTLLLLIFAQTSVEVYRRRFSNKIVNSVLIIVLAIWLVVPIRTTLVNAVTSNLIGQGYSSKTWIESETVQYLLQQQTLAAKCTFYTNDPHATYILAHLSAKTSPARTKYNSPEIANSISSLTGFWPEEHNACLAWFDKVNLQFLFTLDELRSIANLSLITRLNDGVIYSVTRK